MNNSIDKPQTMLSLTWVFRKLQFYAKVHGYQELSSVERWTVFRLMFESILA